MKLFFNLCIVIGFTNYIGFAQNTENDSIVSFADRIIIKANIDTQTDTYELTPETGPGLKLQPNQNFKLYLSLDYEFIGVSLGFAPSFIGGNNDDALKGNSSFSDIQFRFFLGNWVQSIQYKKIKGYYIDNTGDFINNWIEGTDPYISIPSFQNTQYGLSTAYVLNPDFSYRNVLYQTEWQKKSSGSLIPTLFYNYQEYSFDISGSLSNQDNYNIRLAIPYYFTFVYKQNWFVSPHVSPSAGLRYVKDVSVINNIETNQNKVITTTALEAGLQVGYSSNKWIAGGRFNFSASWFKEDATDLVENDQLYALLYVGYRFDPPKFIATIMNKINEKLPQ